MEQYTPTLTPGQIVIYALIDPRTKSVRYVGQTNNPLKRYRSHLNTPKSYRTSLWITELKSNDLQPIYSTLEITDESHWAEREVFWIAHYRQVGCDLINKHPGGGGTVRNQPKSETHRQNLAKSGAQTWYLVDSSGNGSFVTNLRQFCRENGYHHRLFLHVVSGSRPSAYGYKCYRVDEAGKPIIVIFPPKWKGRPYTPERKKAMSERLSKTWEVTSPDGETKVIQNMTAFCKGKDLSAPCMSLVASGKIAHHRGWLCSRLP